MRSERLRHLLATAACVLVAWAGAVCACESLARWAESHPNVYVWWWEEWLQLFTPTNYVGRGDGRVFLCGASEMREGFLVDELEARVPGAEAYQEAFSYATLQSVRLRLDYIESVYGDSAMPDAIVLGLTPRLVLNHPPVRQVPAVEAIERYSPHLRLDDGSIPKLVEKGPLEGLVARYRLIARQSSRYRAAALAASLYFWDPDNRARLGFNTRLRPPKWHKNKELDKTRYPAAAAEMRRTWRRELAVDDIRADLAAIRALCERHGVLLVAVDMPEASWMRAAYPVDFWESYRRVLDRALGDVPLLDLHDFLTDDEFFDWAHPKRAGAARITARVASLLEEHR